MIALGGPCEEHGQHDYDYRLTEDSIANIECCTGIDNTCGEAIDALIASGRINRTARRRLQKEREQPTLVDPSLRPGLPGHFRGIEMSRGFMAEKSTFGLPEKVSRQWIEQHSDMNEGLGIVSIPADQQDGFFTHAEYVAVCEHEDECQCEDDPAVMWELESYSG